ncbi:MAG TPA: sugar ABC transporter permease, partial [Xanthobacteraceae bacterium]|nr:sugar ABC transporter permease [Xanthobacteraceae bacterium]
AMIEGARWRRWVYFYIPLAVFVFVLLFPFYWMMVTTVRPDNELYRPWMAPNYTPFWTLHPTLEHIKFLLGETLFSTWMLNTLLISIAATIISLFCGLLAGLQTINPELQEAAAIDGARPWQRFWHVTWPLLLPVTMVVVLFSVIQTFADFQLVYVLTGGGPANATHLFATYAYQVGIGTGLLSEGAAISLAMFPVLLIVVVIQLLYIRRVETH